MSKYTDQIKKVSMTSVVGLLTCMLGSTPVQAGSRERLLAVTVQGDGTVTSYPSGVSCSTDCTLFYKKHRHVTLTASAGRDSRFLGWGGACAGIQPTCTVKLRKSHNVTALFDELPGNKTTSNSGNRLPVTGPAPEHHATVPGASTGETTTIELGWPVYTVQ